MTTASNLIAEHFQIQDKIKEANKKFAELLAPYKQRLEAIDGELLALLNALGGTEKANLSTEHGTAYISHLLNVSIDPEEKYVNADGQEQVGRMALFDFALERWDEIGQDLLIIQPQKDAVRSWMEEHNGQPPPGLKVSWWTRVNVRRS